MGSLATLLLVIEDVFAIRGRGLLVLPHLSEEQSKLGRVRLRLERPDGTVGECDGWAGPEFVSPPRLPPHGALLLYGVDKVDAPIGTRVFIVEQPTVSPR